MRKKEKYQKHSLFKYRYQRSFASSIKYPGWSVYKVGVNGYYVNLQATSAAWVGLEESRRKQRSETGTQW